MSSVVVDARPNGRGKLIESLEPRVLLSFDPSGREQESLELLNRMRLNPQAELDLLLNANDSNINSALSFFDVNVEVLRQQWATLSAVQPLAWNEDLSEAALFHTQQMRDADVQTHRVPAEEGVRPLEPSLRERATDAGYTTQSSLAENVFAYVKSMLHAHAAYAIDWGNGPDGIQNPPGHRDNIMDDDFREVGISVLDTLVGNETGPMLQTQDFGDPVNFGDSFLVGVAFSDLNDDGRYNAGEGLDGVEIEIVGTGGAFDATTMSAGGYQIRLPEGTYTITARGGGLSHPIQFEDVVIDDDNVKVDFLPDDDVQPPLDDEAPLANLDADSVVRSGRVRYRFHVLYSDNEQIDVASFSDRDVRVLGPDGFRQYARFLQVNEPTNGAERTATYEIIPPDEFWNVADNGIYQVYTRSEKVADTSGNFVAPDKIGEFLVDINPADVPYAELVANRLRSGGAETFAFKVIYWDNQAIDVSDLGDNDLRIVGPGGFTTTAELDHTNSNTDGRKRIGYYTLEAPGGTWDSSDSGRYKVYVRPQTVSDNRGNFVSPTRIGSITVSIEEQAAMTRRAALASAQFSTSRRARTDNHERLSAWQFLSADEEQRT